MGFWDAKNSQVYTRKQLDSKISIAVACAVDGNFCLLNQDYWNDDDNDEPRDQVHESNNDDVKREKATFKVFWGSTLHTHDWTRTFNWYSPSSGIGQMLLMYWKDAYAIIMSMSSKIKPTVK